MSKSRKAPPAAPQIPAPDLTECLRTYDVARKLGISQISVMRLLRAKKLPGFKLGRVWLVQKSALDQYLSDLTNRVEVIYKPESQAS